MLGIRDPQRSLLGAVAQLTSEVVESMGFHGQVALHWWPLLKDMDFKDAYCLKNGRPSVPPTMLATARLLQHYDQISDAQVIDRCRFDLRYKAALDLDPSSIVAPFSQSTFQAFRTRLTLHAKEGLVFERTIRLAQERGVLPQEFMVALDSSPVRGRGAVKDTFNLLSDAIAAVIRSIARKGKKEAKEVAESAGLERHIDGPSIKASELVDWDSEKDVSRFLEGLLTDSEKAVELAATAECASDEVELLKKIIDLDVEREDDSSPAKIRQGVGKDRSPSVSDPEARHSRKSSGRVFTGHKAHTAVEPTSGIITAIETASPGIADGAMVGELIDQTEETTGATITAALGDCAYSSAEAQKQAEDAGVTLLTKMPSPRKDIFGPADFTVSDDLSSATCPAGHPSVKQYKYNDGIRHIWSQDLCQNCPFKDDCTKASQRQITVMPNFHSRRQREQWARSEEGRLVLRGRVPVEHAIGRLKNLGAGTARYFGQEKTKAL
jgi:hypothetical protein